MLCTAVWNAIMAFTGTWQVAAQFSQIFNSFIWGGRALFTSDSEAFKPRGNSCHQGFTEARLA
jgi:hypothetical protein